ncbi:hypothetical protein ACFFMO_00500 [Lederbergia wuyishanensis]
MAYFSELNAKYYIPPVTPITSPVMAVAPSEVKKTAVAPILDVQVDASSHPLFS